MKRGIKLTFEELKYIIGDDTKIIPLIVQNSWCTKCGAVSMKEYAAHIDAKTMEIFIKGKCAKCGSDLLRSFDDDSGVIEKRIREFLKRVEKDKESKEKKEFKKAVIQIKIELKGIKPPIWRRVQILNDITFYDLHTIIQNAMGWDNYHLHQFIIGRKQYIIDSDMDEREFPGAEIWNGEDVLVGEILNHEKQKIDYEYDFGDGWEHRITVEKIIDAEEDKVYPVCIAGKRACPPEDIGGVWGYEHMLEVIKNPAHEDYEEMIEYSGEDFDSEEFDLEFINEMLEGLIDD